MIELISASVLVFSSLYGSAQAAPADMSAASATPLISVAETEQATTTIPTSEQVENVVKAYFQNEPILIDIARCESSFRQYDQNGNLVRGTVNKGDIGVMQINEYYHADKAKALGDDLTTLDGNLAYAQYLYETQGVAPWISSKPCWGEALKTDPKDEVAVR